MGHRAAPLDGAIGVMIPGPGVSSGGLTGQVLRKKSSTDFDTEWVTLDPYTKAEIDALLAGIEVGEGGGISLPITIADVTGLDDVIGSLSPEVHNHNDLYHTTAEIATSLAGKAASVHAHDDLYFTEAEVTAALATKSGVGHSHDDLYYTETEVDNLLDSYQQIVANLTSLANLSLAGNAGKLLRVNAAETGFELTDTPVDSLEPPVLTALTATGANPPEWSSESSGSIVWNPDTDSGDKHRLIWRLDEGSGFGAWQTEDYQELDDELISGGFTWPLLEAAKPFDLGGDLEVKEQRSRWFNNVMELESPESDTLAFAMDPPSTPWTLSDLTTPLYHWWDARDTSTLFTDSAGTTPVAIDGDLIGRANNKGSSGSGADAQQATAGNRIPWDNPSTLNSLPAFDSPGSSNRALTVTTSMGSFVELCFNGSLTSLNIRLDATDHIFSTGVTGLSNAHLIYLEWTAGSGTATCKLYINGVLIETKSSLTIVNDGFFFALAKADTAGMSSLGRYIQTSRLFNRSLDGQRNFDGPIVTLGYGDYVPVTNQRERIEGYLCHLGAIALPGGHTYEDDPPLV